MKKAEMSTVIIATVETSVWKFGEMSAMSDLAVDDYLRDRNRFRKATKFEAELYNQGVRIIDIHI